MTRGLVVIGGGGFGREVLDVLEAANVGLEPNGSPAFDVLGVLDDGGIDPALLEPYNVKHLGPVDMLVELPSEVEYVIGIGSPQVRRQIDQQFAGTRRSPVLIHPSATTGDRVDLGPGSIVCAGVRLTNHIRVGRHVHLNLNSTVGHDASLDNYTTVSPLCAISGNVVMDEAVFLGTGVSINPGVSLGADSVVGSGAVVLRDVPTGATAVGVPAKLL